MVNEKPDEVGQIILDVSCEMNLPVLLNAGWGGIRVSDGQLPSHAFIVNDIPYDWLFSRVRAVVHHGGSGTTHSALRFGKPQLLIPHISDQFLGDQLNPEKMGPYTCTAVVSMKEYEFHKPFLFTSSPRFLWMRLVNAAGFGPMGFPIKAFTKDAFRTKLTELLSGEYRKPG